MEVSANWCITVEYQELSSIGIIFVDYQTNKLQYNYQSYIQVSTIEDAQGFSSIVSITPSRGFNVETLTGVTLLWKTESNKSISIIEDRIPR